MPQLAQLLAVHRGILVLDAASSHVFVGLIRPAVPPAWEDLSAEAGTALFHGVQRLVERSGESLDSVDALLVCMGPGSMLGLRSVAMAVRTWQLFKRRALYDYQSLALAAHGAAAAIPTPFSVIADARRDSWHVQTVQSGPRLAPLARFATAALPTHALCTPEHFRAWTPVPAGVTSCSYAVPDLFVRCQQVDLFRPVASIEPFQHEAPEYQKWSPRVHSAESVSRRP